MLFYLLTNRETVINCIPMNGKDLLSRYMEDRHLTQTAVAAGIGKSVAAVSRWLAGCGPDLESAFLVEAFTGGIVPASSWLPGGGLSHDARLAPDERQSEEDAAASKEAPGAIQEEETR